MASCCLTFASAASAAAGTQVAHAKYGYPYPDAPDCTEVGSNAGCVADKWKFFQGQCTSWVAHRLNQLNKVAFTNIFRGFRWGNASNWGNIAKRLGISANGTPGLGSVAWYASGHVGYVEEVRADGSVLMSEMNFNRHNSFDRTVIRPGRRWPTKFIHLKDRPKPDPLSRYAGHIVQWSGDKKSQKTAWLVGPDLRRRWIPSAAVYHCLKARGTPGPIALPAATLDKLKDLHGVHATCTAPPPAPKPQTAPAPKPAPPPPPPVNRPSQLSNDQRLLAASSDYLRSPDGRYRFVMQSDSNLVLYGPSGRALWASNTVGRGAHHLRMQGDGNLVIYNSSNKPIWASGTPGRYNARLVMQSDGNVVIYNDNKAIWATGTDGRT
jgi:surface antigen